MKRQNEKSKKKSRYYFGNVVILFKNTFLNFYFKKNIEKYNKPAAKRGLVN